MAGSKSSFKDTTKHFGPITSETGPGHGLSRSNQSTIKKKSMNKGGLGVGRTPS